MVFAVFIFNFCIKVIMFYCIISLLSRFC